MLGDDDFWCNMCNMLLLLNVQSTIIWPDPKCRFQNTYHWAKCRQEHYHLIIKRTDGIIFYTKIKIIESPVAYKKSKSYQTENYQGYWWKPCCRKDLFISQSLLSALTQHCVLPVIPSWKQLLFAMTEIHRCTKIVYEHSGEILHYIFSHSCNLKLSQEWQ